MSRDLDSQSNWQDPSRRGRDIARVLRLLSDFEPPEPVFPDTLATIVANQRAILANQQMVLASLEKILANQKTGSATLEEHLLP